MEERTIVRVGTFAERLKEVQAPISDDAAGRLLGVLEAEAVRFGHSIRDEIYCEFAASSIRETEARDLVQSLRQAKEAIAQGLRTTHGVAALVAIGTLMLVCAGASFTSEFVITQAVIPWLLSVSPFSTVGIALSLAPSVAGLVLDRVMLALVDVEDGWNIHGITSRFERNTRRVLRVAFFTFVGSLTLFSVWLLADARAIASLVKMSETLAMSPVQQHMVDQALSVLTVALAINGGLFYLFGVQELRKAGALWRAKRDYAKLASREAAAVAALSTAEQARKAAEFQWQEADIRAAAVADNHRADGRLQLQMAIDRPPTPPAAREVVAGRLNVQVSVPSHAA